MEDKGRKKALNIFLIFVKTQMSPLLLSIWYIADRFEFANTCSVITQNNVFVSAALKI